MTKKQRADRKLFKKSQNSKKDIHKEIKTQAPNGDVFDKLSSGMNDLTSLVTLMTALKKLKVSRDHELLARPKGHEHVMEMPSEEVKIEELL